MSFKKHQENVKRIIGIKDDQESLGKLDPKAPIGGRRGIAYFTPSGNLSHSSGETGAGVPVGGVSMNTYTETSWDFDLVPVPPTNTLPPGGTPTKTVEGSCLNAQPDQNCPKLMDGATTLGGLEGLSDCTTGTPIDMNLLNDTCQPPVTKCDCVDVCVEYGENPYHLYEGQYWRFDDLSTPYIKDAKHFSPFDSNFWVQLRNWIIVYSGNQYWEYINTVKVSDTLYKLNYRTAVIANNWSYQDFDIVSDDCATRYVESVCTASDEVIYGCITYDQQCTEYQWDTCDCYHVEKRGDLKAGWDSVDWYREAVNCAPDPTYTEGYTWEPYSGFIGSQPNGHTIEELKASMIAVLAVYQSSVAPHTATGGTVTYNSGYTSGGSGYVSYDIVIKDKNGTTRWANIAWQKIGCTVRTYGVQDCNNITVDDVCDQYPEKCANSETDPTAEDCNPLELLQPKDCCAPDCDNRDWDAEDCWFAGENCAPDDTWQQEMVWYVSVDTSVNPTGYVFSSTLSGLAAKVAPEGWTYMAIGKDSCGSNSWYKFKGSSSGGSDCRYIPSEIYTDITGNTSIGVGIGNSRDLINYGSCSGLSGIPAFVPEIAPYCTPPYEQPIACDQDPICCKPDGQGGEICTQPKSCQWDSDGKVEYFFDRETGQYKVHPNDPDASLEDQQPKYPQQMNICDSFGKRIDEFTGKDGTRILVYDNAASGGIMYIIRDSDGKIISAGDSTNIDLYKDPDDPFNWISAG